MNRQMQPSLLPSSGNLQRSLLVTGLALGLFGVTTPSLLAQTPDGVDSSMPVEAAPIDPSAIAPEPTYIPAPIEVAPAPGNEGYNDAYIDSTPYGIGATERTPDVVTPPSVGFDRSVPVAPPAVSLTDLTPPSYTSYSTAIGSTPSLKDFYRRTLRPPGRLGNGNVRLIFPLSIPAPITSLFGWRVHPIFGASRFHSGTDIGAPIGTPVLAAYAGQVVMADFLGGYGLAVALNHNQGKQQTLYGHLSEVFVKAGETVKQGTVLGRVGSTGNSTGPHLHFEYRELTPDGWVAMDAGAQLEYALAELVKVMEVADKGIAGTDGLQISQRSQVGLSGEIAWEPANRKTDLNTASTP